MSLEHDRCSELLGPLLRGELSEQDAISVEEHIAGCEECRAERRGLEALTSAPGVMKVSAEPLSEIERARLHRAIADALPASRTVVSEPPKPWGARIAPYLGAAAAVILVVFGATQINLGGSDDDGAESGAASLDSSTEGGGGGDRAGDTEGIASQGGAVAAEDAPAPGPSFDADAGVIERSSLRDFGSEDVLFKSFAQTYQVEDAEELKTEYLRMLATDDSARELSDASDGITECGNQILTQQDNPTLPAYAGYGELEKQDVLMMGFVYSAADSGPLDKFMLWVWPRGDCSIPTESQSGKIKP
jgi:hypothetical protein